MTRASSCKPAFPDTLNPVLADRARVAEISAWSELYRAAPAGFCRHYGVEVERHGEVTLLRAAGIDHPLLNRAFLPRASSASFALARRRFAELGLRRYFVHLLRRGDEAPERVEAAGLERYRRSWVKLVGRVGSGLPAQPEASTSRPAPRVCEAAPERLEACSRILCAGFGLPESAIPLFAFGTASPFRAYAACDEVGRIVAAAYLHLDVAERWALLAGAATDPAFRGRGAQGALMAARARAAARAGCEWISSETGESTPGDPQHSQRNMQRYGLEVVGVIDNYVLPDTCWDHGVRSQESGSGA